MYWPSDKGPKITHRTWARSSSLKYPCNALTSNMPVLPHVDFLDHICSYRTAAAALHSPRERQTMTTWD